MLAEINGRPPLCGWMYVDVPLYVHVGMHLVWYVHTVVCMTVTAYGMAY